MRDAWGVALPNLCASDDAWQPITGPGQARPIASWRSHPVVWRPVLNNPAARRVAAVVIEPPARGLLRLGVSPDAVTIAGTLLSVTIAIACFTTGRLVLGIVLLSIVLFSDLLDGTMARLAGRSGPWGNFLDATLDRITDGAVFGSLAIFAASVDQLWVAGGAIAALVTGQVTSYAKARAEAVGATANVGIAERAERLGLAGLGAIAAAFGWIAGLGIVMWLVAGLGVVTVAQRIIVVRRQLHHP